MTEIAGNSLGAEIISLDLHPGVLGGWKKLTKNILPRFCMSKKLESRGRPVLEPSYYGVKCVKISISVAILKTDINMFYI